MVWRCGACGARWAPGAPCCPECRSAEHAEEGEEPVKITRAGVSYGPDDTRPREGAEAPADGSPVTITQDGDGEPGDQVARLPGGEHAEPEPYLIDSGDFRVPEGLEVLKAPAEGAKAPVVHVPPKPPRRATPPGTS